MEFLLDNGIPLLMLIWGLVSWVLKKEKERKEKERKKFMSPIKEEEIMTENRIEVLKEQTERLDLIPDEHISEEGFSANADYIQRQHVETKAQSVLEIGKRGSQAKTGERANLYDMDWKRAVILKEILDKPVSLRK